MTGNVTVIRESEPATVEDYDLDDILLSVGLSLGPVPYEEVGTSHEVLVSKLERVVRKACKTALMDKKVAQAFPHSCDNIFDEAVRSIASDVAKALVFGRRSEAQSLLSTAALDALSTEIEIRSYAI